MSQKVIEYTDSKGSNPIDTLLKTLGGISESALSIVKQLVELPLAAPTMAAVVGIVLNDVLGHKINLISWTHEEQYCVSENQWISIFDFVTGAHADCQTETRTVPGLITGIANLQIAGIILSAFGISAAGEIIGDITKITNLVGSQNTAPLVTPTLKVLFKGGSPVASLADLESS